MNREKERTDNIRPVVMERSSMTQKESGKTEEQKEKAQAMKEQNTEQVQAQEQVQDTIQEQVQDQEKDQEKEKHQEEKPEKQPLWKTATQRARDSYIVRMTKSGAVYLPKLSAVNPEPVSVVIPQDQVERRIKGKGFPKPTDQMVNDIIGELIADEEDRLLNLPEEEPLCEIVPRFWTEGTAEHITGASYVYKGVRNLRGTEPFYKITSEGVQEVSTTGAVGGVVKATDMNDVMNVDTSANIRDINRLWKFINVPEQHRGMIIGALISPLVHHAIERVIFFTSGKSGSGKTVTTERLAQLIDPKSLSSETTVPTTRGAKPVLQAALNTETLVVGNISSMSRGASDAFCQIVQGGVKLERTLYKNGMTTAYSMRVQTFISTKEEEIALEDDLQNRIIPLVCHPLSDNKKKRGKMEEEWQEELPIIRGAVFKIVSAIKKDTADNPDIPIPTIFRWAGVAEVMTRTDRVLQAEGIPTTPWDKALKGARGTLRSRSLPHIIHYIGNELAEEVEGSPGEVLKKLKEIAGQNNNTWGYTARTFKSMVEEYAEALEEEHGTVVQIVQTVGGKNPRYKMIITPVSAETERLVEELTEQVL